MESSPSRTFAGPLKTLEMTGILTWDSIIYSDRSKDGHGAAG
jgi:hypothetical protein